MNCHSGLTNKEKYKKMQNDLLNDFQDTASKSTNKMTIQAFHALTIQAHDKS